MLTSIALLLLFGMLAGALFRKLRLPYIVGMLLVGILLGPYGLDLFAAELLIISPDLRKIALIIILSRAGLSLNLGDLKKVGRPAVLLCFLPASFEIAAFLLFGPPLLGLSVLEAGILGAVMAAVSPAVVVPRMTKLMDEGWGTKQGVPQMIVAGASADDIYVIVIFSTLLSVASGAGISAADFLRIPSSVFLGIAAGAAAGYFLTKLFQLVHMRDTIKVMVILSVSCLFAGMEPVLEAVTGFSGLLAVMTMCIVINQRYEVVARRLSAKFSKLWVAAELFLFVLVGAAVNMRYAFSAGAVMVVMLLIGLAFRMCGVYLSLAGTSLRRREKVFCLFAEIPKATVQAAVGGVPLAMGLGCGDTVLSFAVVAIAITAPAGAFAMDAAYHRFLEKEQRA